MTDIEIRHFLANFSFDIGSGMRYQPKYDRDSQGIWIVTVVLDPKKWFYSETIPVQIIQTEDDLIRWITGFIIRAFASFIPPCLMLRDGPEGEWKPIIH